MLQVRGLSVRLGGAEVLRGIDLDLARGEVLGVVGASGSGKSTLSLAIPRLLPRGAALSGQVRLDGQDLLPLPERAMRGLRGRRIGMIFQDPMAALNPVMRVGAQIAEGLRGLSAAAARAEALALMEAVRIPQAAARIDAYPHELSGGQRQRIGIAIALALRPDLLIADEPTTALDLTVQAEILTLLEDLVAARGIGLLIVSHDLGVIARMADRMLVLSGGHVVETGPTAEVLARPAHAATRALIEALPRRSRATLGARE
ncbi:ABC transporter ATP-binding protein [Falsirhodobacter algicola]|uniref:ATP-binding cassette domain-containing protein n=1 Tax=Falsirhodobacter algicola TaxID=2692330 RepID=A0A8J8MVJ0_9RHOB|nr:ABC transporter ATP-binding protein [Falsirhodobacter algicola]QUS37299.1 ATP-binding cassette domain-containing protein [Falsirhodobacter algicola]